MDSIPEPIPKPSVSVIPKPSVSVPPPLEIDYTADTGDSTLHTLHDQHALHPGVYPAGDDIIPLEDVVARDDGTVDDVPLATSPTKLRRGTRVRTQRNLFSAKMYHGESTVIQG